jgi:RNA polymerase sigma-70 factor, ECF subfamily
MELVSAKAGTAASSSTFRSLVWPHLNAAYNLARYIVRDPAAAEDVTQDAMLRAYRHFASLRGDAVRPWLLAIVRNACNDYHRSNRGPAPYRLDEAEDAPDNNAEDPEAVAISRDEVATLRAAIAALPEPRRATLVLRELEELSYREIADITAVPIGTVMSRLARARADLQATLRSS